MKPVRTPFTNRVFKLPGGTEENDLPLEEAKHEDGSTVLISTWKLTDDETKAICEGEDRIELLVWGKGHPPVTVRLADSRAHNAPKDIADAINKIETEL